MDKKCHGENVYAFSATQHIVPIVLLNSRNVQNSSLFTKPAISYYEYTFTQKLPLYMYVCIHPIYVYRSPTLVYVIVPWQMQHRTYYNIRAWAKPRQMNELPSQSQIFLKTGKGDIYAFCTLQSLSLVQDTVTNGCLGEYLFSILH